MRRCRCKPQCICCCCIHLADDAAALADDMDLSIDTEAPDGIAVEADPGLLRTALLNLFVNAVKYNEPGGRIEARLAKHGGAVVFTIGNTGPGVPQGDRERVFQRFQRVDPARDRNVDGVGLGLSLAREIIRAHGGELALHESRPGWTAFEMRWVQRPPR